MSHRNLTLESLQGTSTYASKNQSLGGSVSVGYGKMSGSLSASQSKIDSNFKSVAEQSAILAGDGGFEVSVKGNTDLKGGAIASTDKAIADNKNRLTTATLTSSDIQNRSEASASSSGINLSSDMLSQGKYGVAKAVLGNALGNASASGSSSSQTKSAVSAATVTIEAPVLNGPQGTPEGNARLIRYEGGTRVNSNLIGRDAPGGAK